MNQFKKNLQQELQFISLFEEKKQRIAKIARASVHNQKGASICSIDLCSQRLRFSYWASVICYGKWASLQVNRKVLQH